MVSRTRHGYGVDWSSMGGYVTADDFLCNSPMPVTDVHWWGSYWSPYPGTPQAINGFTINFYSDVPAFPADGLPSHPGDLLYSSYIKGNCNETYYGYSDYDGTNVYQYDAVLSDAFVQTPGTVYWLSIVVDPGWDWVSNGGPYWGWHNSNDHWNDSSVQQYAGGGWSSIQGQDQAFFLTTPEPATMSCLVSAR